ncbi:hypothetical protein ACQEU5_02500 [Marinactinospora thermotolerans]|uniref:Uncharacterized protein n=1 Tax=Marinactinospora thermotolerans DSM 45154 TaxID=1122192 RepID=A0A1T4LSW4_9ACTN|nr:hypothetical protein [Marinactinospora thermotolerans]SJZ57731.1 hypothetical protein SAMN02745673_00807 [Marinactinospora thermotolerans DSM 45154]
MTLFLPLAIIIVSSWTLVRSLEGVMDHHNAGPDIGRGAARNRVRRRQGIETAAILHRRAPAIVEAGEEDAPSLLRELDDELARVEAEGERALAGEERREERVRAIAYAVDFGFAVLGLLGVIVGIVLLVTSL